MSEIIDEKVVEMRFNNQQFEKNVHQSINSIRELKESVQMDEAARGLQMFSNATSKLGVDSISSMTKETGKLSNIFNSFINQVAIGGVRKLGEEIETSLIGKLRKIPDLIKSMSIDQISAGYGKFDEKTVSVATLLSQGYGFEEVNEQLNRLNWFTDETSYNFTEMVKNIGKFTASGKKLDESVTAMEGIATWAALSGQNANTASNAMYQLSQAMGSGVMRKEDWKSIQNASMDTREFREHAIEAALALGTLKKNANGSFTSTVGKATFTIDQFADSLTEGKWFNADVMMKVFNDYSAAVGELYEYTDKYGITASEAIEEFGENVDEFGLKAFKAAQEARTFTDVIDSVKDAVSTGWMNTFEIIIGNEMEAVKLFTWMANGLYEIFAESGNLRNEVLEAWKDNGGREQFFRGLFNILEAISNIIKPISDAFHEVFDTIKEADFSDLFGGAKWLPEVTAYSQYITALGLRLKDLSTRFNEFTKGLIANGETMTKIKMTVLPFFEVIKFALDLVKLFVKELFGLGGEAKTIGGSFLDLTSTIGLYLHVIIKAINESQVLQTTIKLMVTAVKVLLTVFGELVKFLALLITSLDVNSAFENLEKSIVSIGNTIKNFFSNLINIDKLKTIFTNLVTYAKNTFYAIGTFIVFGLYNGIVNGINTLISVATGLAEAIVTAVKNALGIHSPSRVFYEIGLFIWHGLIKGLKAGYALLKVVIETIAGGCLELGKAISKYLGTAIDWLITGLSRLTQKLYDFFSSLPYGTIKVMLFDGAILALLVSIVKMTSAFGNAGNAIAKFFKSGAGFLDTLSKSAGKSKNASSIVTDIAILVGVIAASVAALAVLQKEGYDIEAAGEVIAGVAGILLVLGVAIAGLNTLFAKVNKDRIGEKNESTTALGGLIKNIGITLALFGVAAGILVGSLIVLDDLTFIERDIKALGVILAGLIGVAGLMVLFANLLKNEEYNFIKSSVALVIFSLGVKELAKAVVKLDEISNIDYKNVLATIFGLMVGLSVLGIAMKGVGAGTAAAIIACAFIVRLLATMFSQAVDELVDGDMETKFKTAIKIIGAIGGLIAGIVIGSKFLLLLNGMGPNFKNVSIGLAAIAGAFVLLAATCKILETMTPASIAKGAASIVVFSLLLIGIINIGVLASNPNLSPSSIANMSKSFLMIAGAIGILVLVAKLAEGMTVGGLASTALLLLEVGVIFGALLAVTGYFGTSDVKTGTMIALLAGITLLMLELAIMSNLPMDQLFVTAVSMALVIGSLAAVFAALSLITKSGKQGIGAAGMLLLMVGSISLIAYELYQLAQYDWEQMAAAGGALAGTLLALAAVMGVMGLIKFDPSIFIGIGAIILVLASAIGSIAAASLVINMLVDSLKRFEELDPTTVGSAVTTMIKLGSAMLLLGAASPIILVAAVSLAAVAGILYLIAGSFSALATSIALFANIDIEAFANGMLMIAQSSSGILSTAFSYMALAASLLVLTPALLGAAVALNVFLSTSGFSSGVFFAQGFELGVKSQYGNIISTIFGFGDSIVAAFNGSLDIHSPSRKGKYSGKMFGKGVDDGVKEGGKGAIDTTEDLGNNINNTLTNTLGGTETKNKVTNAMTNSMTGVVVAGSAMGEVAGEEAGTAVATGLGSKTNEVTNVTSAMGSAAGAGFGANLGDEIWNSFLDVLNAINRVINNVWQDLSEKAGWTISQAEFDAEVAKRDVELQKVIDDYAAGRISEDEKKAKIAELDSHIADLRKKVTANQIFSEDVSNAYVTDAEGKIHRLTDEVNNLTGAYAGLNDELSFQDRMMGYDRKVNITTEFTSNQIADMQKDGTFNKYMEDNGYFYKDGSWYQHIKGEMEWEMPENTKADELTSSLDGLGDAASGASDKVKSLNETLADSMDMFSEFDKSTDLSASKLLKNMESQIQGMQKWSANLASLKGKIDAGLYEELVSKGASSYKEVNAIKSMSDAQREYMNYLYSNKDNTATTAANALTTGNQNATKSLKTLEKETKDANVQTATFTKTLGNCAQVYDENGKGLKTIDVEQKKTKKTTAEINKELSNYALSIMRANKGGKVTTETVKAMGRQFLATNPEIAKMGITADDVYVSLMEMSNGMEEVKNTISKSVKDSIDIFAEWKDEYELTSEQVLKNMHSQVRGITKWAGQLESLAARGIDANLLAYLQNLGPQGAEYVNAFAQMTAEELQDASATYTHAMGLGDEVADQLVGKYSETGYFLSEGFADGIINGSSEAEKSAMDMGKSALDKLREALGVHSPSTEGIEIGEWTTIGFADGLVDDKSMNYLDAKMKQLSRKTESALKTTSLKEQAYNIGKNVVRGMANGIGENSHIVLDNARSLSNKVIDAVRKAFSIHSPSRVFEEIGMYTDMGLANGLSMYSNLAYNSAEDLAESTMDGFNNTYSDVMRVIDWDDMNPVITPTLDLSQVTDGFRRIGDMITDNNNLKLGLDSNGENQNRTTSGMTFIQNNTSPKALDRIEIYRQTKNLISSARGAMV